MHHREYARRVLVAKAIPGVPVLPLSFLPHPGAELHQLVEPGCHRVMLMSPFGIYLADLTTPDAGTHVRRISTLERVNP